MSTIEYHYQTMGGILSHLVGAGLSRINLDDSDAMDIMTIASAMRKKSGGYAFHGIQLTSKGIAIIQTKPKDPELGESIEKKLAEPGNTDAATYTKIGAFVGGVIAGGIRTLSG
ncbi:hypothetical protein [Rhizobium leguminosarum]|uniref:hypothetical protein n=1 Tax=Rhizobium leguminosarum TaxID=384 RepID=UPI0003FF207D|nr:hypothetical protein [Rhizobium leguminosarum]